MSTTFATTDRHSFTSFYGGDECGPCLQITTQTPFYPGSNEGFVQLTFVEAAEAAYQILRWVREEAERRRTLLKKRIDKLQLDERSIYHEIAAFDETLVTCELNLDFVRLVDLACPKHEGVSTLRA